MRITQFSLASGSVGEYPEAAFKVYNAGADTADRCLLEWHPESPILGKLEEEFSDEFAGETVFSDEFALEPDTSYSVTLEASGRYAVGFRQSAAKVECSNAESKALTDVVLVRKP